MFSFLTTLISPTYKYGVQYSKTLFIMNPRSIILVLSVIVALGYASESPYTSKYDNVDIDKILSNNRVLTNYIKCLMDEGACTAEGRELKRTLPDALSSGCSKCNEKQTQTAEKVIKFLMKNRGRDWERLSTKYDPKGEYKKRFEAEYRTT